VAGARVRQAGELPVGPVGRVDLVAGRQARRCGGALGEPSALVVVEDGAAARVVVGVLDRGGGRRAAIPHCHRPVEQVEVPHDQHVGGRLRAYRVAGRIVDQAAGAFGPVGPDDVAQAVVPHPHLVAERIDMAAQFPLDGVAVAVRDGPAAQVELHADHPAGGVEVLAYRGPRMRAAGVVVLLVGFLDEQRLVADGPDAAVGIDHPDQPAERVIAHAGVRGARTGWRVVRPRSPARLVARGGQTARAVGMRFQHDLAGFVADPPFKQPARSVVAAARVDGGRLPGHRPLVHRGGHRHSGYVEPETERGQGRGVAGMDDADRPGQRVEGGRVHLT
jgi:hypothetical protein